MAGCGQPRRAAAADRSPARAPPRREAWYVLEGTLHVRVGDAEVRVSAGSSVFVPRGTPHTYWNPGPGRARYLLVMSANVYRLIQNIHAMQERTPDALRAVFAKYDSELIA